jgi:hypothetical protein
MEMCVCGLPLHYVKPESQRRVEELVRKNGEFVKVTAYGRSFQVPRHFIALHGIASVDVAALAYRYGFEEVAGDEPCVEM